MSDNLNQIIASGYPQGSGSNARYVFTCHSCGGQVVTQNEYSTGQGGLLGATLSSQAQYGLSSLLWRIPIIGSILSSLISGKISERQSQGTQQKMEEAKRQAFEEVRGRFSQCTRCETMACSSCFSNGLCRTCLGTEQVQRQAADQQKGGSGGQEGGAQGGSKDPTKMWE